MLISLSEEIFIALSAANATIYGIICAGLEAFLHSHLEYLYLGSHIHFFLFHKSFLFFSVNNMILILFL